MPPLRPIAVLALVAVGVVVVMTAVRWNRTTASALSLRDVRPVGLGMLSAAELRRELPTHDDGRIAMVRIDPESLSYSDNRGAPLFAGSALDPRAPQRLVTAAARRLHRSTGSISYVVLAERSGRLTWSAYFRGGAAFRSDVHGRGLRRVA